MIPMDDAKRNAMSRLGALGQDTYMSDNADEGKAPMAEVRYREADDPAMCCATCAHYQGDGSCDVVAGEIDPRGVSDAYAPREQMPMQMQGPATPMQ